MPLYICNSAKGAISEEAKPKIAADVTRIHCDVTGAPPDFVHVFFFEEVSAWPMGGKTALLFGSIRAGRTDAQKTQLVEQMQQSFGTHAGISTDDMTAIIADTPASWVMEGGDLMPEPGEESEWLKAHEAKRAGAASN